MATIIGFTRLGSGARYRLRLTDGRMVDANENEFGDVNYNIVGEFVRVSPQVASECNAAMRESVQQCRASIPRVESLDNPPADPLTARARAQLTALAAYMLSERGILIRACDERDKITRDSMLNLVCERLRLRAAGLRADAGE